MSKPSSAAQPVSAAQALSFFAAIGAGFWLFFVILRMVLVYAPEPIGSRASLFAEGARMTLWLTAISGVAGVLAGIAAGLMKLSSHAAIRWPAELYIWILRGTPLLVQILFVFYALPALLPWLKLNEFSASVLALSLNVGAYNAEVIRAGILAVPRGQSEAARSLGLSKSQTMIHVVLPQAFRITIPPLINNIVALLKDSSLASSISLLELTLVGNRVSSETFLPVPVLTTVALVYLALTTTITTLAQFLERRMGMAQ